jgi:hypothetical protein
MKREIKFRAWHNKSDVDLWLKEISWWQRPVTIVDSVLSDEEIEKSIPYPEPISKHQADQNIGWIKALKFARDKMLFSLRDELKKFYNSPRGKFGLVDGYIKSLKTEKK